MSSEIILLGNTVKIRHKGISRIIGTIEQHYGYFLLMKYSHNEFWNEVKREYPDIIQSAQKYGADIRWTAPEFKNIDTFLQWLDEVKEQIFVIYTSV